MQSVEESLEDINLFLNNSLESILNSDADGYKQRMVSLLEGINDTLAEQKERENNNNQVQSFENINEETTKALKDSTKDMSEVVSYMNVINEEDISLFSDKIGMLGNAFMSLEDLNIGKMNKLDRFLKRLQNNLDVLNSIKTTKVDELDNIPKIFERLANLKDFNFDFLENFNDDINSKVVADFSTNITDLVGSLSKIKPITEEQFNNIDTVNKAASLVEQINADGLAKTFSDLATNKISPKKVEKAKNNLTNIFDVFNIDAENSITTFSEMMKGIDYKGLQESAKSMNATINSFSSINDKGIADLDLKFKNINDAFVSVGEIDLKDGLKGIKRLIKSLSNTNDINAELVDITKSTKQLGDNITTISDNLGSLENIEKISDFSDSFNNVVETLSDMNKGDFSKAGKNINRMISSLDSVEIGKLREFNQKVDKLYSSFTRLPDKEEANAFNDKMNTIVNNLTSVEKSDLRKMESSINDIVKSLNGVKDKNIEIFSTKTKSLTEAFKSISEANNIDQFSSNFKTITDTLSSIDKTDIKGVKKTINNVVDYLKDANVKDFTGTITTLADSLNTVNNYNFDNAKENLSKLIETYATIDKKDLKKALKNFEEVKDLTQIQNKNEISTKLSEKYSNDLRPIETTENKTTIEPNISNNRSNETITEKLDKLIDVFSVNQKELLNSIQSLSLQTTKVEEPVKETTEEGEKETGNTTTVVPIPLNNSDSSGIIGLATFIKQTNALLEEIKNNMFIVASNNSNLIV